MTLSHSRQQMNAEIAAGVNARVRRRGINPESEAAIQAAFFEWIELHKTQFPILDLFYAIPNAAKRGKLDGWIMSLTGTRRGIPDTHLPCRSVRGRYIGLYIEFKSEKGVVRPEQKEWIAKLQAAGHRVEVLRSWSDAANVVIEYLGLPLARL